jgi:hypothetical protein
MAETKEKILNLNEIDFVKWLIKKNKEQIEVNRKADKVKDIEIENIAYNQGVTNLCKVQNKLLNERLKILTEKKK